MSGEGSLGPAIGRPRHLFVYGTLMSPSDHPMARLLAATAERIGEASCAGRLYLIDDFPGLVASADPAERAFGELFRLHEPGDRLLAELDLYEGCGPDDPEPTLYVRVMRKVSRPDGTSLDAWVYLYNRPVAGLRRIVSGRFVAR